MSGVGGIFSSFLENVTAQGSRSTVVRPLLFLQAGLLAGLLISLSLGAVMWIQILLASGLVVAVVFFIVMYVYFARTQPDALRSESYALRRQLIDKGLVGDAHMGRLVDIADSAISQQIDGTDVKKIESS